MTLLFLNNQILADNGKKFFILIKIKIVTLLDDINGKRHYDLH